MSGQSMRFLRIILVVLAGLALTACSSKFKTYNGPEITSVQVQKANRKMYLLHNSKVIKDYDMQSGWRARRSQGI